MATAMAVASALTVTLGMAAEPAAALAPAATKPKAETVSVRPDVVSARLTARAQGVRVEVESLRDETSTTWVNPDGTMTTQAHAGQIRFRDPSLKDEQHPGGGAWRDVDLTLGVAPDGTVAPQGHPSGLSLAGGSRAASGAAKSASETDIAGVSEKKGRAKQARDVTLGWSGNLGTPVLKESTATYKDVKPGVDLVVDARRTGFEQHLVINTPEALSALVAQAGKGSVSWDIPVKTKGLTARSEMDGSVSFVDADGAVASRISAPVAWDAVKDEKSDEFVNLSPVKMTVAQKGSGRAVVTLTPDQEWLTSPDRTFPITIDPTYASGTSTASFDTYVSSAFPTATYSTSTELRVGTYDGGGDKYRSFLTFPISGGIGGKDIISGSLSLYEFHSYSCTAKPFYVYSALGGTSSTNWNNQPSGATSYGSLNVAKGFSSSCAGGRVSVPVTSMIQSWAASGSSAGGVRLSASETDSYGWKKFYSVDSSQDPYITYTYNRKPNLASAPTVAGANSYTAPGSSNAMLFTNQKRPTLSTVVTDPDSNGVYSNIQVHSDTSGSALVTNCVTPHPPYTASGTAATCTLSTDLPNNDTYYIRASAGDDQGLSNGYWSPWTTLYVSQSTPPAPSISCTNGYANNTWTDAAPTTDVTCTISAPGVAGTYVAPGYIDLYVDGATTAKRVVVTASNDPAVAKTTVSFTNAQNGPHTIKAIGLSRSMVPSPATNISFGWGGSSMTLPKVGTSTSGTISIAAAGPPKRSASTVTGKLQWRVAGSGNETTGWSDGPTVALSPATSSDIVNANITWDTRTAVREAGASADLPSRTPILLDVQYCFVYGGGATQCTWSQSPRTITRLPHAFGNGYPVADAGPGQVALYTGEFNTSATDVSVPGYSGDLAISRSHTSFDGDGSTASWPNDPVTGVFGPGWTASLEGPDAGAAGMNVIDNTRQDGSIVLIDEEGNPLVFANPDGARVYKPNTKYLRATDDTVDSGAQLMVGGTGSGTSFKATTLTLVEEDGTVTTWSPVSYTASTTAYAPTADVSWKPVSVNEAGQVGSTTYSHDAAGRVIRIIAPVPPAADGTSPAVTCSPTGTLVKGCRALNITYATVTVGAGTVTRVASITATLWDPEVAAGAGAMATTTVASYTYDTSGRLVKVLDPRTNLGTDYTWDGTSTRLASVKATGLAAQRLAYDTTPGAPRVTTASRDDATGGSTAVTTTRIQYGIAVTGSSSLPDLSASAVEIWNQASAPVTGYAVFGLDDTGTCCTRGQLYYADAQGYTVNTAQYGAGAWQVTATDYDDKGNTVRELDAGAINTAKAAVATGAALNPAEIDALSTQTVYNDDISASVDPDGAGPLPAATKVVTPAGTLVTDVYGPARDAMVNVVGEDDIRPVRPHTHTDYDQGAPNRGNGTGINPDTLEPWRLPTTVTTGAASSFGAPEDPDVSVYSTTVNSYAKLSSADATEGDPWKLGSPTKVTTGGIASTTRFDAEGRTTSVRQPLSTGTDAGTTNTVFYTAGTNPADSACGNKVEWAGLTCWTGPAAAPTTGAAGAATLPDSRTTKYNQWLSPLQEVETSGTATRTTETRYDTAARTTKSWTTTSGVTGSTARAGTYTHYRTDNGLVDYTGKLNTGKTDADATARTTTTFDAWGRAVTSTNDLGDTTTTTYVAPGQPGAGSAATIDEAPASGGGATQRTAYFYDGTDADGKSERRNQVTRMTITRSGTGSSVLQYQAAYDADGQMVTQKLPGAITQRTTLDAAGEPVAMQYTGQVTPVTETTDTDGNVTYTPGTPVQNQPWLAWSVTNDTQGRVRSEATGPSAGFDGAPGVSDVTEISPGIGEAVSYDRTYQYDSAGRLQSVIDRTAPTHLETLDAAPCDVRSYYYDNNGRRTKSATTSHTDGDCTGTSNTTSSSLTWAYDTADRPTAGANGVGQYTYDAMGRQTTIPSSDAPSSAAGNITLGYYDDDLPRSVSQNGTTTTFVLDSANRRLQADTTTGTQTTRTIRHYTEGGDNPSWIVSTDALGQPSTIRYAESIGGDLGASIYADGSAALSLANLHGDVVTTVPMDASQAYTTPSVVISGWSDYAEFGTPRDPAATAAVAGAVGYGWLGAKQRSTTAETAGLTLMGDRLYNGITGRFTALDPEPGGNASSYGYPNDPINQTDLDGHRAFWKKRSFWKKVGTAALWGSMFVPGLGMAGMAVRGAIWGVRAYRTYRAVSGYRSFRAALYVTRNSSRARAVGATFSRGSFSNSSRSFVYHYGKHGHRYSSPRHYHQSARRALTWYRGSTKATIRRSPGGKLNHSRDRWHSFW